MSLKGIFGITLVGSSVDKSSTAVTFLLCAHIVEARDCFELESQNV